MESTASFEARADALRDDLLARCQRGEAGAWRELYRANVDRLWRFARRSRRPCSSR